MSLARILATLGAAILIAAPGHAADPIGDPAAGERLYQRECGACHQIGEGAANRVGPQLNRIFDRRAGAIDGFNYSRPLQRMAADGLVWRLDTLDAYIENPRALVSGTRMSYRGLRDPGQRADLLAYLRAFSDSPQDMPEAAPTARTGGMEVAPEILALVGDVEYGEYLAQECVTCHLASGSDRGIPAITGWPEEDFVVALHAYRRGLRPHAVMQNVAQRLDDEQIAALAAYFAGLGE